MRTFIGSGQYRQIAPLVNAEPGALVIPSPHDSERVNLTALSRQVCTLGLHSGCGMTARPVERLQAARSADIVRSQ